MNLSVDIAGVTMKNPVTTGSGTFGSGEEFSEFVDLSKLGAVTTKGVANVPWPGNSVPRVAEVYGGMLNAIGLQAFGQRDPVVEYRLQGYDMFNDMTESIREETVKMLMHVRIEQKVEREQVAEVTGTNKDDSANAPVVRKSEKISRNAPCPCGSGKKYKYCCGR